MPLSAHERLENFTSVITADAISESMKIYDRIKRESEGILSAAENDCLEEMFRYIKTEAARIRNDAGRTVSRRMMDGKRALYERRAEMGASVIGEVTQRLRAYVETPDYRVQLRRLAEKAVETFAADTVIYLRAEDMPLAEELSGIQTEYALTFEQGGFTRGGLTAVCPSRRLQIDETFDTTLEEIRGHFAELLGLRVEE